MKQKFAHGVFTWNSTERRSQRYGSFFVDNANSLDGAIVVTGLSCDVKLLQKLVDEQVKIIAVIVESRQSTHMGDRFLNVFPTTPKVNEEIEIGVGKLFLQKDDFGPFKVDIGLKPSDGRENLWINPRNLYRLHEQTCDFYIEKTSEPDSPLTDLVYPDDVSGAISNGDGSIQMLGKTPMKPGRIKLNIESLGDGLFVMHHPNMSAGQKVKILMNE